VPDARKGERLILMTQQKDATRSAFQAFAKAKHASDLMIPADVWVEEKLPMLGTGKVDMMTVAKLVQERLAAKAQAQSQGQPEPMVRATG
jgi:acyl-[acyl-carrier-protein]-phospholipid O-acyltransferase/long-chain-fatty-acid--[acyl-carrier-protein] ligase